VLNKIYNILFPVFCVLTGFSCIHSVADFQFPTLKEPGLLTLHSKACFFDNTDATSEKIKIILDVPDKKEIEQIDAIMKFTGLPQNFSIYRGNISTAMAAVVNNQRFIIYNKKLLANNNEPDSAYWSSVFILAHEIGHHLADNISDTINFQNAELEADRFAGTVLYSMGADSNEVLSAITSEYFSGKGDSISQPSKAKRIATVKTSWFKANKNRYESVIPPTPDEVLAVKEFTSENLVFNSKWNEFIFEDGAYKKDFDALTFFNASDYCKKLKGVILDVQRIQNDSRENYPEDLIQLRLVIKMMESKSSCINDYAKNEKIEFNVDYEPFRAKDKAKDLYDFFVPGRRLEFDIIFLKMEGDCDGCPYNISRAKAI